MLFRSTDDMGVRRLFGGTKSQIGMLIQNTTDVALTGKPQGYWNIILSALGGTTDTGENSQWRGADLKGICLFTNNYDIPRIYSTSSGAVGMVPDLNTLGVLASKFVWSWGGFLFLANTLENGTGSIIRYSTRVRWCDLNTPLSWAPPTGSVKGLQGLQDLPYGDEIIGGGALGNGFYIFTRSSIFVMAQDTSGNGTWTFTRVYNEPETQYGCLAYPNTLVSVGDSFYYASRDGLYHWNPYMQIPERDDWLHRASGVMYKMPTTAFSGAPSGSPIAWYRPSSKSVYFSWPGPGAATSNWSLKARIDQKVTTVIDAGFTAATSIRFNPVTGQPDTETPEPLVASGADWCIKQLGGADTTVFYREMAVLNSGKVTNDIILLNNTYTQDGYYSNIRGTFPLGLESQEKQIRCVQIQHDTSIQDTPCIVRLRIGNSNSDVDVNDTDDVCAPLWTNWMDKPLSCPEPMLLSQMNANGLRASAPGTEFWFLYEGRYLYYDILLANPDGSAAVGGDTCWSRIDCQARAKPLTP